MSVLAVVSVEREADALRAHFPSVIVAGIGRVNAAAATTEALLRHGPFDAVLSAGVAGALPGSGLTPGDLVVAEACIYFEEGIVTPDGFATMSSIGFPIGPFEGNRVPVDDRLGAMAPSGARRGVIATVATCSGTDDAAALVASRCGAIAEAMEGAAVVHAALRLGVPAIEIRAISNTTGERSRQAWDLRAGCAALGQLRPMG
ncbi:MAG: futalosine hydrolase [Phycisphaeraceae bacterium]|nr:futalosine hydrolase [Phycisphaeraceae bacterium]